MGTKVYFRADGNSTIGLGHVIRSLALADILKPDFDCYFLIRNPSPYLREQIEAVCQLIELPEDVSYEEEASFIEADHVEKGSIVVLDGYGFSSEYQRRLKGTSVKVVCIDDLHEVHFFADAVINHNPLASASQYSAESYTRFCFGFDYLLLRKDFLNECGKPRNINIAENIFICMGGADPLNLTLSMVNACLDITALRKIAVVTGGAYKFSDSLEEVLAANRSRIVRYQNLDALAMIELMRSSQAAIAPASSISLELMCIGVNLITGYYVENQKELADYINRQSLGYSAGDFRSLSHNSLKRIIFENINGNSYKVQKALVQGNSMNNLGQLFKDLEKSF